jgi:hypothetical protein
MTPLGGLLVFQGNYDVILPVRMSVVIFCFDILTPSHPANTVIVSFRRVSGGQVRR